MALIQLTRGYVTIVDDDLAGAVMAEGRWFSIVEKYTVYAGRNEPCPKRGMLLLHRWIIKAPPGVWVDHRDGDGLNNQRSNLRLATRSQNRANSVAVCGASGFRGVYAKPYGRFETRIGFRGQTIQLGYFGTPEEASAVYESARAELFGDFAPDDRIGGQSNG